MWCPCTPMPGTVRENRRTLGLGRELYRKGEGEVDG